MKPFSVPLIPLHGPLWSNKWALFHLESQVVGATLRRRDDSDVATVVN